MSRFAKDVRGNAAVVFALSLTVLASATGIALDYARSATARTEMQKALDAAALAAASASGPETARTSVARDMFAANFSQSGVTPLVAFAGEDITVSGTLDMPTTLAGVIGVQTIPIKGTATARARPTDPICILLTEPTETALYANSLSRLKADCGIQVNSSSNEAAFANSGSSVTATSVLIKGRYRLNSGGTISPTPTINSKVMQDPLQSLPEPTAGGCNYNDVLVEAGQTRTLSPGSICQKLIVNSGGIVVFNPGTYHFKDAEFLINSGSKASGSEVTLFFSGEKGTLTVNSNAVLQITGPKSGTYKGIAIFQSRGAATLNANPHLISSHSDSFIEGTIYAPTGKFLVNSDSIMNAAAKYTFVIAKSMVLNSSGTFHVKNDYVSGTPLPDGLGSLAGGAKAFLLY